MQRLILGGLLAAAAFGGVAVADDDTGAFYLSPMVQYSALDTNRHADSNTGGQVSIGYNFAPGWAAEFLFSSLDTEHNNTLGGTLHLYTYGVDFLKKFMPDSPVQPYVLFGVGKLDDVPHASQITSTAEAEAGAGILAGLGPQVGNHRLQFRFEAKLRHEFSSPYSDNFREPNDLVWGAGLLFSFGAPVAPPPVPKTVAVVPPPDSDGDGVPDDIDRCPNTPPGAKVDQYGCEFDSDGDGVVDRLDECPNTPKGTPVDAKGCPLDSDGDGVIDALDKCPNTPKGDKVDAVGCTIKDEIKLQGVNFATDSAELVPESDAVLAYAIATLKKYPNLVIEVRGHTDNTGTRKHNVGLSQRRAETVLHYLKDHGVSNTMTAKGFGEDLPIADNKTAEGRLTNRRVALRIVGGL